MDFERTTIIGTGADAAFARLSDPLLVPRYVPLVGHAGSDAEDGIPAEGEAVPPEGLGTIRFHPDAAARRLEWGEPEAAYRGSMTITAGTASTCQLTISLHTRDDVDRTKVDAFIEEAARNLRRVLAAR
ncbi:MAG TPA: hypothetical protein VES19_00310 [Candidatus Limnocylindrales bacterium]|nr:hypothetical protein [Candidatus Limnocylindrales bacterium]